MRLPIILMLAVIVLTPANIREVTLETFAKAQQLVAELTAKPVTSTQVAELADDMIAANVLKTRHDTAKNSVGNIR